MPLEVSNVSFNAPNQNCSVHIRRGIVITHNHLEPYVRAGPTGPGARSLKPTPGLLHAVARSRRVADTLQCTSHTPDRPKVMFLSSLENYTA